MPENKKPRVRDEIKGVFKNLGTRLKKPFSRPGTPGSGSSIISQENTPRPSIGNTERLIIGATDALPKQSIDAGSSAAVPLVTITTASETNVVSDQVSQSLEEVVSVPSAGPDDCSMPQVSPEESTTRSHLESSPDAMPQASSITMTQVSQSDNSDADVNPSEALSGEPIPSTSSLERTEPATNKSSASSMLVTARNTVKTSLSFIEPFLDGLPIPGIKGLVTITQKVIALIEACKVQANKDAFERFATRCNLIKDTLSNSVQGKDILQFPPGLIDSIAKLAEQLEQIFQKLVENKSGRLGAIMKADEDTALLNEVNTSTDQIIQLFWIESVVSGRIAVQDVNIKLDTPKRQALSNTITSLTIAKNAAYDSYMPGNQQRATCFKNTRVTVLNEILGWIRGCGSSSSIYILDGIAGIGKSTIAQTVATLADKIHLLGASFFFSRNEAQLKTAEYFFQTIAFQLACYNKSIAAQIVQALDKHPDDADKLLQTQFKTLVIDPMQQLEADELPHPILLVIDALDECDSSDASILLNLLAKYIPTQTKLKVLITTRPEAHICQVLDKQTEHQHIYLHDIDRSIVSDDLRQYLQFHLSEEQVHAALPSHHPCPWSASSQQIENLLSLSGTFFIIASTAVKFILDHQVHDPQSQLDGLLSSVSAANSQEPALVMDVFYAQILCNAVPQTQAASAAKNWISRYQSVLGAIISLQTPLASKPLAKLLGIVNSNIFHQTLVNLHSLVAPVRKGQDDMYQVYHESFPDFLTNKIRVTTAFGLLSDHASIGSQLYIDPAICHMELTKHCLRIIGTLPKWNICNLTVASWYKSKSQLHVNIPEEIAYACIYWINHLEHAILYSEASTELMLLVQKWIHSNFISWLEVLLWVDGPNVAHLNLVRLQKVLTSDHIQVTEMAQDGCQLIAQNLPSLQLYPMHLYWSALCFLPVNTALSAQYCMSIPSKPKVSFGHLKPQSNQVSALRGHTRYVTSVVFSPDGSKLASGSLDGTVRFWEPSTGSALATLEGHTGWVTSVVFSPDGSKLASESLDRTVRLWEPSTGSALATLEGHTGWVTSVVFSPDGYKLASGSNDRTIRLWEPSTGSALATLEGHTDYVKSVVFSPDGSKLASGSADSTVRLWNPSTGSALATLEGHTGWVTSVVFSPDGSKLASGSNDRTVRLWEPSTGSALATLEGHTGNVRSVAFSPDGSKLASGSDDSTVRLWEPSTGSALATLEGHTDYVRSVVFSPDGSKLASGSNDSTVRLWKPSTGSALALLEGHTDDVRSVVFSSDGSKLASGSDDSTVRLWNPSTGSALAALGCHTDYVRSVVFSPDGSKLASGSDDSTVRLWEPSTGSALATLEGHTSWVTSVVFSPDGSKLASGSDDRTVRLWEPSTGSALATLEGHTGNVTSVVFSPDGSKLASGSDDRTVRLWNPSTGSALATLGCHTEYVRSVVFSPDGSKLASGSNDRTVRLWEPSTGSALATLEGHTGNVRSVVFSPDGSKLASGSDDSTVRLWEPSTGSALATLEGHAGNVTSVVFSPDGSKLASGSDDSTVSLWEPSANTLLHKYCSDLLNLTTSSIHITSSSIFVHVQLKSTPISGLLALRLDWDTMESPELPFLWFPAEMTVSDFALDPTGTWGAAGCSNGQVLGIDISDMILH